MDGCSRWLFRGGDYSRNKGNDLDGLIGLNNGFAQIEKGDIGRMTTKIRTDVKHRSKHPRTREGRARNLQASNNQDKRNERSNGIVLRLIQAYLDELAKNRPIQNNTPIPESGTCNGFGFCTDSDGNYCKVELLNKEITCERL